MISRLSILQSLSLAGMLATLLIVSPAFGQQAEQPASPAAAPEAPKPEVSKPMPILQPAPTTVPGRPDIPNAEVSKVLRGVQPRPTRRQKTSCQSRSSSYPKVSRLRSTPAASRMRVRCGSATREPSSSQTVCATRSMLSSTRTGNARQK